jgi:hypothetical protein
MTKLVNIAFQAGTHGNYLRFVIDKMSKRTPELQGTPFTDNNTSHIPLQYSKKVNRYHPKNNKPFFENRDEPHVLITVEPEDLLLLERSAPTRTGNLKVDVTKDQVAVTSTFNDHYDWNTTFKTYYNLDILHSNIPKFLIRDFYKLSFLDPSKSGFIKVDKILRSNKPKNTFEFPLSHFWDAVKFSDTLQKLSEHHNLDIEEDKSIHQMFLNNLPWTSTQHRSDDVIEAIQENRDVSIVDLDTIEQAYLSAWIEKNNKFVVVPVCNSFFSTTGEIITWLKYYPQHYKAMNPNLPTFNNIPNPFHLWNKEK